MAIIVADSCSYAHVAAAVAAASSGDTVQIPAGSATWSSQLSITKGLVLQGIGTVNITGDVGNATYLVLYQPADPSLNETFRMTGIIFDLNNDSLALNLKNTSSAYACTKIRIDHCSFLNMTTGAPGGGFLINGPMWGVIDNNTMSGDVHCDNYAQNDCDDWALQGFELGTGNNLYWEDNTISHSSTLVSGGHGGRYCYRYNTITYTGAGTLSPMFDMHGNQPAGVTGPRGGEIYENTMTSNNVVSCKWLHHRGGKMIAFNNTMSVFNYMGLSLQEEYSDSISCDGAYTMHVNGSYYWNNRRGASLPTLDVINDDGVEYEIAADVDFWNEPASFDGSTGVGFGLLAARPSAAGLADGIGYWATDTNKLYHVQSETWVEYYTPYTYPHPLRRLHMGPVSMLFT